MSGNLAKSAILPGMGDNQGKHPPPAPQPVRLPPPAMPPPSAAPQPPAPRLPSEWAPPTGRPVDAPKPWYYRPWFLVSATALVALAWAASGGLLDGTESAAPTRATTTTAPTSTTTAAAEPPAAPEADWSDQLQAIAAAGGTPRDQLDGATRLGREIRFTPAEAEAELSEMVDHVKSREILNGPSGESWAVRQLAVAKAIEIHFGAESAAGQFAFDYYQVVRDLFRGTEAVGSDFINANLRQLDNAIAEGLQ